MRAAEDTRDASWASAAEPSLRARSRTIRTTWFSPEVDCESCKKDADAPVASLMTRLASAKAFNSSPRLLVSDSKVDALVMQSWCKLALDALSDAKSLEVACRSPVAVALRSELAAIPALASFKSALANLSSSFSDWSN